MLGSGYTSQLLGAVVVLAPMEATTVPPPCYSPGTSKLLATNAELALDSRVACWGCRHSSWYPAGTAAVGLSRCPFWVPITCLPSGSTETCGIVSAPGTVVSWAPQLSPLSNVCTPQRPLPP